VLVAPLNQFVVERKAAYRFGGGYFFLVNSITSKMIKAIKFKSNNASLNVMLSPPILCIRGTTRRPS